MEFAGRQCQYSMGQDVINTSHIPGHGYTVIYKHTQNVKTVRIVDNNQSEKEKTFVHQSQSAFCSLYDLQIIIFIIIIECFVGLTVQNKLCRLDIIQVKIKCSQSYLALSVNIYL